MAEFAHLEMISVERDPLNSPDAEISGVGFDDGEDAAHRPGLVQDETDDAQRLDIVRVPVLEIQEVRIGASHFGDQR